MHVNDMSFSMVTECILCVSRIPEAVFRNLVLQTNTFSNRQPTKKNLTQTISDRKMRVSDAPQKTFLLASGNIKRHIFIPKQRPQNQKTITIYKNKQQTNPQRDDFCHQQSPLVKFFGAHNKKSIEEESRIRDKVT